MQDVSKLKRILNIQRKHREENNSMIFFSFLKKAYGSIEAHHALCRRRKEETTNKKKMKPSEKDSKSRERNAMLFYVKRMRKMHCSKQ
jgi:hypothetical protein